MQLNQRQLKNKAYELRKDTLRLIYKAKTGHTGGDLSELDILTVLYYRVMKYDVGNLKWPERDRFILSKGHAVEAFYSVLADVGYFQKGELDTISQYGSQFIGHPTNKVPGIELNSGSLGHGLSLGVGMALAAKMNGLKSSVYVLMGDGELAEGSVWEAAMSAAQYKLNNLCAIIDRNGLQISGKTEDVMGLEPLKSKWESFGFCVMEVDGHDFEQLENAFLEKTDKPKVMLARTTKGKGVSYMENVAKWHHGVPTDEQLNKALNELEKVIEDG